MTTELALRTIKGSPLTHEEVDSNFTNLRATADTAADDIASLQTDFETVTDKANATAIGIAPTDNDMGAFAGSTIADASTVKDALQALETANETFRADLLATTSLKGANMVGLLHDATVTAGTLAAAFQYKVNPINQPFNAVGDGVADDTAALQAALNFLSSLGGGVCEITHNHLIDSANLSVPRYVSIRAALGTGTVGNPSFFGHIGAYDAIQAAAKIIVNPSYRINGLGCQSFEGLIFARKGLALDGTDLSGAYTGEALRFTTTSGVSVRHCTFLGFNQGSFSDGGSQIRFEFCQFDCLNGIRFKNGFDINTAIDCRAYNFLQSGITGNTDVRTKRDGIAYLCDGTSNGGHQFINCFAFGYRKAFSMETAGSYLFQGCWADGGKDSVTNKSYWSDGVGFNLISGNTSVNAECQLIGNKFTAQNTGVYVGAGMYGVTTITNFTCFGCTLGISVANADVIIADGTIRGHFTAGIKFSSQAVSDACSVSDVFMHSRESGAVDIDFGGGDALLNNVRYIGGLIAVSNKVPYTVAPVSELVTYEFNRDVIFVSGTGIVGDSEPKIAGKIITFIFDSDAVTTYGGPDGPSTFYNDVVAGNFVTLSPFKATAGSSITFYRNKANTKWIESSRTLYNNSTDNSLTVYTAAGAISVPIYQTNVIVNKATGAATTVNLPASPPTGKRLTIKDGKGDAATNNITIVPAAGTIDGAASNVISTNYGSRTIIYNGVQWNVI